MLKTTVTVKESKSAINAFMYCELYLMYFAMISCPKETTSWSLVKSYVVQEDKSSRLNPKWLAVKVLKSWNYPVFILLLLTMQLKWFAVLWKWLFIPSQPEPFLLSSYSINLLKHIYNNSLGLRKIPRLWCCMYMV